MCVLLILYRSTLRLDEVRQLFRDRAHKYREVSGLLQKIYVRDPVTGEVGGIYIFDGKDSLERFRTSNLEKSIRAAYRVTGPLMSRTLDVLQTLRELNGAARADCD